MSAFRPLVSPGLSAARAACAAAGFGTAAGWAFARRPGDLWSTSVGAPDPEVSKVSKTACGDGRVERRGGRPCMNVHFATNSAKELEAKEKTEEAIRDKSSVDIEDKVPMGQVYAVVECKPGGIMQYKVRAVPASKVQAVEAQPIGGETEGLVFSDYAVVLTGRIEQYLAQGQSFPATAGPGSFLTQDATLHNSWQAPCQIALVRL